MNPATSDRLTRADLQVLRAALDRKESGDTVSVEADALRRALDFIDRKDAPTEGPRARRVREHHVKTEAALRVMEAARDLCMLRGDVTEGDRASLREAIYAYDAPTEGRG